MRTIVEGRADVKRILGIPRLWNELYRLNRYLLRTDCSDGTLLHNVVTGEMVLLNSEESAMLDSLPSSPTEIANDLILHYFLVPQSFDEKKMVQQLRTIKQIQSHKDYIDGYVILPTTYCNARCFYCYESDYKHVHMTKQTAMNLVDYMDTNRKNNPLKLSWFGGEPLVGAEIISFICQILHERGIPYISSMTSNGYLFTQDMICTAKELWNLQKVQITIDGTEETYNQTKAYINTIGSPFQRVMENIDELLDAGIAVRIRVNIGMHNLEDAELLLDQLEDRFNNKQNIRFYLHRLFDEQGFEPVKYSDADIEQIESFIFAKQESLRYPHILDNNDQLPCLRWFSCMADNDSALVVTPDGSLRKCEHIEQGVYLGNLLENITNTDAVNEWKIPMNLVECDNCPMYPSCFTLRGCEGAYDCTHVHKHYLKQRYKRVMNTKYQEYLEERR